MKGGVKVGIAPNPKSPQSLSKHLTLILSDPKAKPNANQKVFFVNISVQC